MRQERLEEIFLGRFIQFKQDGNIIQCPPFTYDSFLKDPDWYFYDSASDIAYDKCIKINGWVDITDYNDEYLSYGFDVSPISLKMQNLINVPHHTKQATTYEDGVSVYGLKAFIPMFVEASIEHKKSLQIS